MAAFRQVGKLTGCIFSATDLDKLLDIRDFSRHDGVVLVERGLDLRIDDVKLMLWGCGSLKARGVVETMHRVNPRRSTSHNTEVIREQILTLKPRTHFRSADF